MPTGLAIAGRPWPPYWMQRKAHFPRVHGSSLRGAMPTVAVVRAVRIVSGDQGTCSTGTGASGQVAELTIRSVNGTSTATSASADLTNDRYCRLSGTPIQTTVGSAGGCA